MNIETHETQVQLLFNTLMTGIKVDRVFAWHELKIADLRSRLSDVQRQYNIVVDRNTKKGKRYREYYLKSKVQTVEP